MILVGSKDVDHIPALKSYPPHLLQPIDWDSLPSLSIASFGISLDIFGDDTFLVVSTPGHTPTHLSALIRTSPDNYVLLASDCCHQTDLVYNAPEHAECEFAIFGEGHSFHENLAEAGRSLERIRACGRREDVFVVVSHHEKEMGWWNSWS